jgi:hypothetical protein
MKRHLRRAAVMVLAIGWWGTASAAGACPPQGWTRDRLLALPATDWSLPAHDTADAMAPRLLSCLADPDPALRDGVAFEAFSHWLRGDALAEPTRRGLLRALLVALAPDGADADGFRQPFSALVLSEVARNDRKSPWMTPGERQSVVDAASRYMQSIHDHRGFVAGEGWRHGVAHDADLMLQLALNPAVGKPQLDQMLAALATQVAPPGHPYVFGEPGRLARAVAYAGLRGLHSDAEWKAWLDAVSAPTPYASWRDAGASEAGLARFHDVRAFLLELDAAIDGSKDPALLRLAPMVAAALASTD